ncbi:hypothetical protein MmTuc01_0930 [Methanosarcina mazei Tuc01]|uniref:Uncharacterized protein n=1 Tax=Methanosarcina mazei Tuc01 TaxID=1236903 RepID=M1Q244_METMZ|nr:hypothetical protein MmTuc01_0930 [Methanosarcina mazei Tuc01]
MRIKVSSIKHVYELFLLIYSVNVKICSRGKIIQYVVLIA